MSKIPEISKNQITTAKAGSEIASVVWNTIFPMFPIGKIIPSSVQWILNKKLENATEILIEELKKGNIHYLNDEKYEALIPAGLKLLKAAIEGEANHNLRILAMMIRGYTEQAGNEFIDLSNAMDAVRGLSFSQLQILNKYNDFKPEFLNFESNKLNESEFLKFNKTAQFTYKNTNMLFEKQFVFDINFLKTKGLLMEYNYFMGDYFKKTDHVFALFPTELAYKIISLAGSIDLDDLSLNPSPFGEGSNVSDTP